MTVTRCRKTNVMVIFFYFLISSFIHCFLSHTFISQFKINLYFNILFCISVTATRGFIRQIDELQVSLFPKVKVERSLALERHLLTQPQENGPNQARRSLPAQALRVCKNVPIGARGRKRKTLQFIGCAPNPDGRQLKQPVPSSPVRQQEPESSVQPANRTNVRAKSTQNASVLVDHLGSPFYQPAKRTYSRATSTPFAGANETSLNVTFDESFGRLHYDSSDSE